MALSALLRSAFLRASAALPSSGVLSLAAAAVTSALAAVMSPPMVLGSGRRGMGSMRVVAVTTVVGY